MREPSEDYKVQAPSIPEIKEGVVTATMRLARTIRFRTRKLRPGPLINAVLLHFLSMPATEQERVVRENLARYEELLKTDDVQSLGSRPMFETEHDVQPLSGATFRRERHADSKDETSKHTSGPKRRT